jgi:hypothetical protein
MLIRDLRGGLNLQATLGLTVLGLVTQPVVPHHPIECSSVLRLDEDGTFSCAHASAPPDDQRTQCCLDLSVALLLIELADERRL